MKLVVDATFAASLGTFQVVEYLLGQLSGKYKIIHVYVLRRDYELYRKISQKDPNISIFTVRSYVSLIAKLIFSAPSTVVFSTNNIPPICPLVRRKSLLIHNIFYVYTLSEIIKRNHMLPKRFIFKYFYFRIAILLSPPSSVFVQTNFMRQRVQRVTGRNSELIATIGLRKAVDFALHDAGECDAESSDIILIGGGARHKNVSAAIDTIRRSADSLNNVIKSRCSVIVVGVDPPPDHHDDCCGLDIRYVGVISPRQVQKYIRRAKVCLITSLAESLCMPVFEVASQNKPLVIQREEYSEELLSFAYFYDDAAADLISMLMDALSYEVPCELHSQKVQFIVDVESF